MKLLKIAQVAPLWYPVPPVKYGGTEKIVSQVTEGLVKRKHKVTLFATGNSKTKAQLVSFRKNGLAQAGVPWTDHYWSFAGIAFAFNKINQGNFDITHSHTGVKTCFFSRFCKTPLLLTFHNPLDGTAKDKPASLQVLDLYKDKINAVFISKSQRNLCPVKFKKSFIVYNGVDENLFKFNPKPKDYLLWVGRVEENKGVKNACLAAKKTNANLLLVGKIDPQKQDYFNTQIKPFLNEKIKFLGEKTPQELVKLYQNAKALLYPIEWQEPFGLVMAEAMACGAPVIVFDNGSAKEVVKDKESGFVVPYKNNQGQTNINGLIRAMENIETTIQRGACRKWVEENFTLDKMVGNYEKIYYEILNSR